MIEILKNIILSIMMIIHLAACSGKALESSPQTVVSEKIVEGKLVRFTKSVSNEALCNDVELFNLLIQHVQPGSGLDLVNREKCRSDPRSVLLALQESVSALNDQHASIKFSYGLASKSFPVIENCSGDARCPDFIGSVLLPIPQPIEGAFAFAVIDVNGKFHSFLTKREDEEFVQNIQDYLSKNISFLREKSLAMANGANFLLLRGSIDSAPKKNSVVELSSVDEKFSSIKFFLSYEAERTIIPDMLSEAQVEGLSASRAFGCDGKTVETTSFGGMCISSLGKGVIWIDRWPDLETVRIADEIERYAATTGLGILAEWTLDVSGNLGGDTFQVTDLLCSFGSSEILDAMNRTELVLKPAPAGFVLSNGRVVPLEELRPRGNEDLLKIRAGIYVRLGEPAVRPIRIPFLDRHKTDPSECQSRAKSLLVKMKATIRSSGNEFSATENFLHFVSEDRARFRTVGRTTRGGTGNPTTFTLPGTGIEVRLSRARQWSKKHQRFVIEGEGVSPQAILPNLIRSDFLEIARTLDSAKEYEEIYNFCLFPLRGATCL